MPQSRSNLATAVLAAVTLAACSGNGGSDGGACVAPQGTCTATTQCCAGYACENGSCEFVTSNGSSGSTGATGSSSGSSTSSSTGGSSSGVGSSSGSGSSSSGFVGPCSCTAQGMFCDPVGRCVQCTSDSQCAAAGADYPYCVTSDAADYNYGTCVQCNTTAQCASQGGGVCDPAGHSCDTNGNCIDGGPGYCTGSSGIVSICDPTSGECVACEQNSDCPGQLCDPGTKSCVDCLAATDCPYSNPGCFAGLCGSCAYDGDCLPHQSCDPLGFPACACSDNSGCGGDSPTCEVSDAGSGGVCGCTLDSECGSGNVCEGAPGGNIGVCELDCALDAGFCSLFSPYTTPACDSPTGQCIVCATNADCVASFSGLDCIIDGGLGNTCVACLSNPECADAGLGAFCVSNNCVACLQNSDCVPQVDAGLAVGPYCENNYCVQCNADGQCNALDAGTPYCSPTQFSCVSCDSYSQCPPTAIGCNSSGNTCGGCSGNSDCPPGDGCQFGLSFGADAYCAGMCGLPGAPTDGGCVQCFQSSDCGDGGTCNLDAGTCKP